LPAAPLKSHEVNVAAEVLRTAAKATAALRQDSFWN